MSPEPNLQMLDWDRQPIDSAADRLLDELSQRPASQVAVLVPGRRVGRLLERALLHRTASEGGVAALVPPRILTESGLVAAFFEPTDGARVVDETVALVHWLEAMEGMGRDARRLLDSDPEDRDRDRRLLDVVGHRTLCDELDQIGLDPAEVPANLGVRSNPDRWRALSSLRDSAHRRMAAQGLVERTARLRAMVEDGALLEEAPSRLLALGITDPGPLTMAAYRRLGDRLELLVDAPESRRADFDEHGRPLHRVWCSLDSPIDLACARVVDRPADAAQVLLDVLTSEADPEGVLDGDRVTVGLCDERCAELISRAGRRAGLPIRPPQGPSIRRTQSVRMLELVRRHLADPSLEPFLELLRLPMFERLIARRIGAPADLDLPAVADAWCAWRVGGGLEELRSAEPESHGIPGLAHLVAGLVRFLRDLSPIQSGATLAEQGGALAGFLDHFDDACCPGEELDLLRAHLQSLLQSLARGPGPEPLEPSTLLGLLLHSLSREVRPPEAPPDASGVVPMVGWLDARLDPASCLVLFGFNEAAELGPRTPDAWLPDSVRCSLGLACEQARQARDAHAIHAMAARCARLEVLITRYDLSGEPVAPSRLFLGPGGEASARRILHAMDTEPESREAHEHRGTPRPAEHESFVAPAPPRELEVTRLSVTDFGAWIRSPMRFWLERREKLEDVDPDRLELDRRSFGILAHDVLDAFGGSDLRDSTDPRTIADFLSGCLADLVRERFGRHCLPAIRLQARMLDQRFTRFAELQADEARSGWRSVAVERDVSGMLEVPDGAPVELHGRIDRIDRHESGRWRLLDYKTSDGSSKLSNKLTRSGEWKDLQLPLYDHLWRAEEAGPEDIIELGYVALPSELSKVEFRLADWSALQVSDGLRRAGEIVVEMRAGRFESGEPEDSWNRSTDGIDRILRSGALEFAATPDGMEDDS